jgi:hypothetical protein
MTLVRNSCCALTVNASTSSSLAGVVTLTKSLKSNSSFLVTATDRGVPPRNAKVPVFVYVVPSASFVVQFAGDQQAFTATVPEDRPIGYVIGTVRAVYADPSVTGVLQYYITDGNDGGTFYVDQSSGTISLATRLDYELERRYAIEITARDSTATQLSTRRNFTVMVTDVNDNAPLFDRRQYVAYVSEDARIGSTIVTLDASDADRGPTYSVVQYGVVGGNASTAFSLDPVTGIVTLRVQLNQTRGAGVYSMTVLAVNPGTNASATAHVTIVVVGVNWFPPVFDLDRYSFVLPNGTSVIAAGTVIGHVRASDRDVGIYGRIEYYAVSGGSSSSSSYTVDRESGAIVVAAALSAPFPVAQFAVLAKNPGPVRVGNFGSCSVIIVGPSSGGGEQVPPPSFGQLTYAASVREDAAVGTSVVQVTVNVFDASSTVTAFAIVAGNDGGAFAIDVSGLIRVARKLNRDVSSKYNLSLSATVSSKPPSTGTIFV